MKLSIWLVAIIASSDAYRRVGKHNYRRNRPTPKRTILQNRLANGMIHFSELLKNIQKAQAGMEAQNVAIRQLAKMKEIVETYK